MCQVEIPTASEVSGLAPGTLVEVKGNSRCEGPLKSEMTQQVCVYYLSQIIREYRKRDYDEVGSDQRRSEVMASSERFAPFVVEDGWGAAGVRGEGAEVDALEVMNRFEKDPGAGGITLGGATINLESIREPLREA